MSQPPGGSVSPSGGPPPPPSRGHGLFISAWNAPVVPTSNTASVPSASASNGVTTASSRPNPVSSMTRALSTPGKKPSKKHYKETVTILVGSSKQPFVLHKGLLCFYSDFFRAAFEGSFREASERRIELPDEDIDTFEAFQFWVYSQSLRNIEDPQDFSGPSAYPSFQTLARLWVFVDKYQIPILQNRAIDALVQKNREEHIFTSDVVKIAYENTMEGSPLRRFAIDFCVFRMVHYPGEDSIFRDSNLCDWTKEAFVDFARCMSNAWENKLPKSVMPKRGKCYYHVHAKGEHC